MSQPQTSGRPGVSPSGELGDGRIVVGLDGSASSGQALRWALRQAAATGGRVQGVACWEIQVTVAGMVPIRDLDEATELAARDVIADVAAGLAADQRPAVEAIEVVVVQGSPARMLVEAAEGATLLVVGSHGRGAFGRMLLGSVGLHCASHAPCPVVIVRPDKHGGSEA